MRRGKELIFDKHHDQGLHCESEVISTGGYVEYNSVIDLWSEGEAVEDNIDDPITPGSDQDDSDDPNESICDSEKKDFFPWNLRYWYFQGCMKPKSDI